MSRGGSEKSSTISAIRKSSPPLPKDNGGLPAESNNYESPKHMKRSGTLSAAFSPKVQHSTAMC